MAYCAMCFDVKKLDADLKSGHKGIGGCVYYDSNKVVQYDYNFFGAVEATGTDAFKNKTKNENDWNYDQQGLMSFDSLIGWSGVGNDPLNDAEVLTLYFES